MLEVPIWRDGRPHSSAEVLTLNGYDRQPVARVHQAPALVVHRAVAALHQAAAAAEEDPACRRRPIARAGRLLVEAELGGLSPAAHAAAVTRATGMPLACSRRALAELAGALAAIDDALAWQAPGGDVGVFATRRVHLPGGRTYAWVPAGRVLGFVAPSNHAAVHFTWVLALAMGYSVAVRPGAADPLTPWRLLLALRAAGFAPDRVALLPGSHDLAPALIEHCDRTVVYGGPALADLVRDRARVRLHGPGKSKVLVDAPRQIEAAADLVLRSITHAGGMKCTCASAVVQRGPAPGLLEAVAGELQGLPLLDPLDPAACVPVWREAAPPPPPARCVHRGGLAFIQPALVRADAAPAPPFGLELPAPWAVAAAVPAGSDPLPLLRGSLAVSLLSDDQALAEACLLEPGIAKVYQGAVPTWTGEPGAPHEGRLAEFLFTSKAWREGT